MKQLATALVLLVAVSALSADFAVADELPLPHFTVSPGSCDFGFVGIGEATFTFLTVTNPCPYLLTVTASTSGAPFYCYSSVTLKAYGTAQLGVLFAPATTGSRSGYVRMSTAGGSFKQMVTLTGFGED